MILDEIRQGLASAQKLKSLTQCLQYKIPNISKIIQEEAEQEIKG